MKTTTTILAALLTAFALTSCDKTKPADPKAGNDSGSGSGTGSGDPTTNPALESVLLDAAPDGALSIVEARKNPAPGTEVVLAGKVMGKMEPFVDGYALVVLGDPTVLTSCDLRPDDECKTPWDVCCDTPEDIKASIATIQVVDDNGRPLKQGLKGLGGMKELSSLVVTGTVAEGSGPDNLLVNATGIHIAKAP